MKPINDKSKKILRLRTKFSLLIVSLILFGGLATTYLIEGKVSEALTHELEEKGVSITHNLAVNSVNPILTDRPIELQHLINNVKNSEEDILFVYILDEKGKVIVHTFDEGFPKNLLSSNVPPSGDHLSIQLINTEEGFIRDIAVPILDGEAGVAHVGLSEKEIRGTISDTRQAILAMTFAIVILGIFFSFFFAGLITKPLEKLTKSAGEIGKGNLAEPIQINSKDEIGILASSFSKMQYELKSHIEKINESSEFLMTLFDNIEEGIMVIDPEHIIIEVNPGALRILNVKREDSIGKSCHEIDQNSDSECNTGLCAVEKVLETGTVQKFTHTHTDNCGNTKILEISASPVLDRDGKIFQIIQGLRDVTESKNAEKKLKEAYEELKSLEELKSNIISNVSHELKTPITIMQGSIELIFEVEDPEEKKDLLDLFIGSIKKQEKIINDLLVIAQPGLNPEKIPQDLNDILNEVIKERIQFAEKEGIIIQKRSEDDLPLVPLDRKKIFVVLENLLDNAIKFNRKNGGVTIQALMKDNHIEISVEDSGIGIDVENENKIFTPLTQLDPSSRRKFGGTGSGLAVAKKIVESHGGKIWVKSRPGEGTTFYFTLPISASGSRSIET